MRVYHRAIGNASWASAEDYLPAGNALGYNYNWRFAYSGGELLMMSASGEPSGYYPMDSSGVMVQNELSAPCKCAVVVPTALPVCPPLEYGGCGEDIQLAICISLCMILFLIRGLDIEFLHQCTANCVARYMPSPVVPPKPDFPRLVPAPPHTPGCVGHFEGSSGRVCVTDPDFCIRVASLERPVERHPVCVYCCRKIKWESPSLQDRCLKECNRRFPRF